MQTETIIYIIIAAITALLLALFQYIYKSKLKSNLRYILAILRTISFFAIILLLINPKFESITYFDENQREFTKQIDSIFYLINKSLSTYIPTSDISKINKGDTTVVVDVFFQEVFQKSKNLYEETILFINIINVFPSIFYHFVIVLIFH